MCRLQFLRRIYTAIHASSKAHIRTVRLLHFCIGTLPPLIFHKAYHHLTNMHIAISSHLTQSLNIDNSWTGSRINSRGAPQGHLCPVLCVPRPSGLYLVWPMTRPYYSTCTTPSTFATRRSVHTSSIILSIHHSSFRVFIIHHFVYSSPIISSVHHPSFRLYIIHHFVCTSPIISSIHHPSFRLYIIHPGLDISRVSCYGTVSAIHRNLLVSATSHWVYVYVHHVCSVSPFSLHLLFGLIHSGINKPLPVRI